MLEHLNSASASVGTDATPSAGWRSDTQIETLAGKMGVLPPAPGPWLQMLCEVVEQLPYAMLVTDMRVPGLPITYCNAAMVTLTGYDKGEIYGRNCRFLQGPRTEAATVREMVVAIRTATVTTVRVTNYRRDGSTFINAVTMSPVHDSNGVYRYSIGVLSDSADSISDGAALEALRAALPKSMQADAQPPTYDPSLSNVDAEAQLKQYRSAVVAFTRLEWSSAWDSSFKQLLMREGTGYRAFISWLQSGGAAEDAADVQSISTHLIQRRGRLPDTQTSLRFKALAQGSFRRFVLSESSMASMEVLDPRPKASAALCPGRPCVRACCGRTTRCRRTARAGSPHSLRRPMLTLWAFR